MGFMEWMFGRGPGKIDWEPTQYQPRSEAFRAPMGGGVLTDAMMRRVAGDRASMAAEQSKLAQGDKLRQALAARAAGASPGAVGLRTGAAMGRGVGQAALARGQEQARAQSNMQNWLNQQMQARIAEEQLKLQQKEAYNQLMMQRELANAQAKQQQGIFGPLLSAAGAGMGTWLANNQAQAPASVASMGGAPQYQGTGFGFQGNDLRDLFPSQSWAGYGDYNAGGGYYG